MEPQVTGKVSYRDVVQETSVTGVAVCMGVKEMGNANRAQGSIQLASESGSRTGTHADTAEQLEEH